jgi:hypothetical protein
MKKITALFSLLLLLFVTKVSAQEKNVNQRTKMEVKIVKNGKVEKGVGYLITFDMKDLKIPYSAIIIEKKFIENAKQAILYFPLESGHRSKYEVEDISKYMFTEQSNNLAIIRLGELANHVENNTIYANAVFVPAESISDFSFPLDKIKLKELKESWEKSMVIK